MLLVARVVNVAVPLVFGQLVNVFEKQYSSEPPAVTQSFWPYLLVYVALRFLQGSGGLPALRDVSHAQTIIPTRQLNFVLVPLGSCDTIFR